MSNSEKNKAGVEERKLELEANKVMNENAELFSNLAYQEQIDALKAELEITKQLFSVQLNMKEQLDAAVAKLEKTRELLTNCQCDNAERCERTCKLNFALKQFEAYENDVRDLNHAHKEEQDALVEALEFYANGDWEYDEILKRFGDVQMDEGEKAREALNKIKTL